MLTTTVSLAATKPQLIDSSSLSKSFLFYLEQQVLVVPSGPAIYPGLSTSWYAARTKSQLISYIISTNQRGPMCEFADDRAADPNGTD